MTWSVADDGAWELRSDGQMVGWVKPNGWWCVLGLAIGQHSRSGLAYSVGAGKAEVEAALWAQTAQGLVGL